MCDVEKKKKIFGNKSLSKRNKDERSEIYFDNEIWNGKKNFSLFSNNGIIKKEKVLKKTTQFVSNKK